MDITKKYLFGYYLSLQKDYFRQAFNVGKKFKRAEIHKFRISIKKINAFRSFLSFISPGFEINDKNLRKIYKIAGKLRTFSLLKEELKKLKIYNKEWKVFFRIKGKKAKKEYMEKLLKFKKNNKYNFINEKNNISFLFNEENDLDKHTKHYLKNIFYEISHFVVSNTSGKSSLHDLRKKMKEFGYNYVLLTEALFLSIDEHLLIDIGTFNKILGKWHDKIVFRKFILNQTNFDDADRLAEQIQHDITKIEEAINIKLLRFETEIRN